MAFHVACPITCRRICYCSLGFPGKLRSEKGKEEFLEEVERIQGFLSDPLLFKVKQAGATVQVSVPKVVVVTPPPPPPPALPVVVDGDAAAAKDDLFFSSSSSVQSKRAFIQKKAAAASLVAEDFARRFESGVLLGATKDLAIEEQAVSNAKVMCRLCFSGENEGSDRERKMLSCKSCGKKYHRSCLKAWAQHRDLFHWSSWTCPSCRICEACRKTDDPHKLMFCKRCDGAYHCYCQQPMHKNVSSGPYLCPKHTRCHSCGSTVPGNGLSVRWFLGYTCCDACGRLFVKGNYCPVCLKVYRDSESTPMVCCDVCERWVHCQCDGISDEKYMQFQVDGNLQYRCATCRGECYQVRDVEDAVQELWRRRDKADQELTASLRAAAGLPTQEEIFSISPYSDDEDYGPTASKNQYSRSLKFSLKGPVDKSPKKGNEFGKKSPYKKYGKKRGYQATLFSKTEPHNLFDGNSDAQSIGYITADNKDEDAQSGRIGDGDLLYFPGAGSLTDGACSINQTGLLKHRFMDEISAQTDYKISRGNGNKQHGLDNGEDVEIHYSKSKTTKGPKLVIHLGNRNRNVVNSPRSNAPNYPREQELTTSNGSEDMSQQRGNDKHVDIRDTSSNLSDAKGENTGWTDQMKGSKSKGREGSKIKIRTLIQEVSDVETHILSAKRSGEGSTVAATETPALRDDSHDLNEDTRGPSSTSHILQKDLKPLLKLKFKNPYSENQSLWAPPGEEEKNFVKGQRSKRKRPSMEKTSAKEEDKEASPLYEDNMMDEIMDANWIIQKLGKDAIGKKVEVHRPSNNSWHKGMVTEVFEHTSIISVALDDGNTKVVDLSKLGVRFVSQRHRR